MLEGELEALRQFHAAYVDEAEERYENLNDEYQRMMEQQRAELSGLCLKPLFVKTFKY